MIGSSNLVLKNPLLVAFALFLGLAVFIHWANGGFQDEFGGEPDAAAHFVTGLMVRDYLAAGAPASPMEYASNYYLHYPKVSLGHWPPFFYVVEAVWMLLFGVSPLSLGLLMSFLLAVLATLLSEAAREEFCTGTGLALGALAVSAPLTQSASRTVMMECLVALLVFRATLAFGRYLDTGRWLYSAWFGVIASLACLTKGVAFFLGMLPPLSTFIRGDFRLFGRPSWWLPAFVVAALCAPWYLLAPGALHSSADLPYGVFAIVRPWDPFRMLFSVTLQNLGWWLVPFLVIGIADRIVQPLRVGDQVTGFWAANAALVVAYPLFSACIQPAREPRHLVSLIPPLLLFAAAGVARVFRMIPLSGRWKTAAATVAVALVTAERARPLPQEPVRGYAEVAKRVLSDPAFANSVLLICADAQGEGAMIAELARRETHRPGHIVLRGSKVLASESWSGASYRLVYSTPERVMEFLSGVPVGLVVVDSTGKRPPHHALLKAALDQNPETFVLEGANANRGSSDPARGKIEVYRMVGQEAKPPGKIRIDMTSRIGRIIGN